MATYRELIPPAGLRECVECIWISEAPGGGIHRVLPDGCADIIYTRDGARSTLLFAGPMTCHRDFALPCGSVSIGIRFRPAMWTHMVRLPGQAAADEVIALEDLRGKAAALLLRRLDSTEHVDRIAVLMTGDIRAPERLSSTQRAIQFLEQAAGQTSIAQLAESAGLSERQFRRRCLDETGLSPKLLGRILRFRKAQSLLPDFSSCARLAAECGYYDQSHLIAEFKKLSGRRPTWATTAHRQRDHRAREQEFR